MTDQEEHDLLLRLRQGDLTALGGLYDRHRHLVYRTALSITGDEEVAADLLHDTFLRLYRFGHRFDPNRPLEPWLYRMAANLAYNWVKRRGRWQQAFREMAERIARDYPVSPSQRLEHQEGWLEVRRALLAISAEKRVVVVLHYLNDLSIAEISEALDLPEGTVKSRLHYGRLALRSELGLEGAVLPRVRYEPT